MKRMLLTGGAGFLGSHLCDKLLAEGNEVICLDNLFTGVKTVFGIKITKCFAYNGYSTIYVPTKENLGIMVIQLLNMS